MRRHEFTMPDGCDFTEFVEFKKAVEDFERAVKHLVWQKRSLTPVETTLEEGMSDADFDVDFQREHLITCLVYLHQHVKFGDLNEPPVS